MSQVKYYTVTFPRKKALVTFNPDKRVVTAIQCTNSVFCNRFRIAIEECPQFCEVIAEVKKYVLRGRKPRAEICEVGEEEVNKEAGIIREINPLQVEVASWT